MGFVLGHLVDGQIEPTQDNAIDVLIGVFCATYGEPIGREIGLQTQQDILENDPDVVFARDWAIRDIEGVYGSGGTSNAAGFYAAANGML